MFWTAMADRTTSLAELAFAATEAIGGVTLMTIAGFILSHYKILTKDLLKPLAELNLYFFTPCLLFSNMASTVTADSILELWPLPAFHILFIGITWLTAQIGSRLLSVPKQTRPFVEAGIIFSNTNNWPVALVMALSNVTMLQKDPQDSSVEVLRRGLAYVFMYALFGNLVRWSWGYNLLAKGKRIEEEVVAETSRQRDRNDTLGNGRPHHETVDVPSVKTLSNEAPGVPPTISVTMATPPLDSFSIQPRQGLDTNRYKTHDAAVVAEAAEPNDSVNRAIESSWDAENRDESDLNITAPGNVRTVTLELGHQPSNDRPNNQRSPTFTGNNFGWTPSYYSSDSDPEGSEGGLSGGSLSRSPTYGTLYDSLGSRTPNDQLPSSDVVHIEDDEQPHSDDDERLPLIINKQTTSRRPLDSNPRGASRGLATLSSFKEKLYESIKSFSKQVLNPPVFAALLSIVVGLCAPVRNMLYGPNAPLKILIAKPIELCGDASVPLTLVSLGGQLFKIYGRVTASPNGRRDSTPRSLEQLEREKARKTNRALVLILVARLLLMPVISTALVLWTRQWLDLGLSDPMFVMTLMILGGGPTAVNLLQICQVHGSYEDEMASLLFWSYVLVVPTQIACVMGQLWIVGQLNYSGV
ncbi:auxin efflux carrier [Gonapodya prolifera JEL478]|uniref:Auxin efflux carrier n=1 Tax=Gonapodya prolifera (strain JEL478) TaxID=1344416 RepID=A0A139AMS2_GONPJ|nr:auxin efflux carrier [Gonapodya prolifera JEL478]|eukprot:KXS18067.1 auxin efflux carrier [Gonapodya prolifera JEL478]